MNQIPRLLVLLAAFATVASAQTVTHLWRFAENDPGAVDNGLIATTTDQIGGASLTAGGEVRYLANTPGSVSSLSAAFYTLGGNFTGNVDANLGPSSSFIIEGWFSFDGRPAANTNILFYNGNPSSSGLGLYVTGNTLQLLAGGQSDNTVGTVNINSWNYVALVYDNGQSSVYLNSDTVPTYSSAVSFGGYTGGDAAEKFYVGGGFYGAVDELRVSTFSGSFNTSMLSYSAISVVPEPSAYAALAGLAAFGLVAWRRRTVRA
jgi:hypothetical protein